MSGDQCKFARRVANFVEQEIVAGRAKKCILEVLLEVYVKVFPWRHGDRVQLLNDLLTVGTRLTADRRTQAALRTACRS